MKLLIQILFIFHLWFCICLSSYSATLVKTRVDASDLPRNLLRASAEYKVKPGKFILYYPQWMEGVHGPTSPIKGLAEIRIFTPDDQRVYWERDPHNIFRILVDVPNGVNRLKVDTTFICSQHDPLTMYISSHATPLCGVVSWNTCLLYPEGHDFREIEFDITLTLPEEWKAGSSLSIKKESENVIEFQRVSYHELVDSPVICGKYYRRFDLTPKNSPSHFFHLVAESKQGLNPDEEVLNKLKNLFAEAMQLYGTKHSYDYHLLLILSDNLPFIGLEHLRCSLNVVGEDGLDPKNLRETGHLIAHEYSHRWCGKYHRPKGMVTTNHHTPKDTRLLWVYEGLDQYLGMVLAARSGLLETEHRSAFLGALQDEWTGVGKSIVGLTRQKGRRSINLEDTASASHVRRTGSRNWTFLYRPQDYYLEGSLLWYEIDAILRQETNNTISLDDFILNFLGRYDATTDMMPYDEETVIDFLNKLHPYDWAKLIDDRVRGWHEDLPLSLLERVGYRIVYNNKPTPYDSDVTLTSLGMKVGSNGHIVSIVPGSLADRVKLAEGMNIEGINGRKFSEKRFKEALMDSTTKREIELLLLNADVYETVVLEYDGGLRYIDIVRNEDKPDLWKEIFSPQRSK